MKGPLLVRLGKALDDLPVSPSSIASRVMRLQAGAAEHRAMHNAGWLARLAHAGQQARFGAAAQLVVTRWQLARRGWASQDTWDLDRVLADRLGAQLLHMAELDDSWPGAEMFSTPEAWELALRQAGGALSAYADADTHQLSPEDFASTREGAKESLRWVADHLEYLWW